MKTQIKLEEWAMFGFILSFVGRNRINYISQTAMDWAFSYGLKYEKGLKYTHLSELGKSNG